MLHPKRSDGVAQLIHQTLLETADNAGRFPQAAPWSGKARLRPVDIFGMSLHTSDPGGRERQQSSFATISFKGGVLTIAPNGPKLTEREATAISSELRPAMAKHMKRLRKIVLDLTQVAMMTSFGLGMCVEIRNTADALGVRTILAGLNPQLEEMIRMLKVDRLFSITHDSTELSRALAA